MQLLIVSGLAVAAAFCAVALKKYAPEISAAIAVAAGGVILLSVLMQAAPVIDEINSFMSDAGIDGTYGAALIKTIGICFIGQFTADACRDAGQSSLASKVELAAKVTVTVISLPMFAAVLNTALNLINTE